MTTVVLAPDSFKGSLRAAGVAAALARGWARERPDDRLVLLPMADGGEGTLEAFEEAAAGARRMPVEVVGPDDSPVDAYWLLLPDGTGVVELAATSGIELLGEARYPLSAHTFGFGQAILAAVEHGVTRLILGIGSSASTDGGAGLLTALGARLVTAAGEPVTLGAAGLGEVAEASLAEVGMLPPILVLTDVTNPLLGPRGAAAVFGPQKGLDEAGREVAEAGLARLAAALGVDPSIPGSGAAGGTGMALLALGARLMPGSDELGELLGLRGAVEGADAVVTGEGRFDSQSLSGKVPGHILEVAAGTPVLLAAGQIDPDADLGALRGACALAELSGSVEAAVADPARWLEEAGSLLARDFSS